MDFNKTLREKVDEEFPPVDNYKLMMQALRSGEDVDFTPGIDDGEGPSGGQISYAKSIKEGAKLAYEINGLKKTEGFKEGDYLEKF